MMTENEDLGSSLGDINDNDTKVLDFDELIIEPEGMSFHRIAVVLISLTVGTVSIFHYVVLQFLIEKPKQFYCLFNQTKDDVFLNETLTNSNACNTPCQNWKYSTEGMSIDVTLVTEFNLYCESPLLFAFIKSSFLFCVGIGVFTCGKLSDKFGRKRMMIVCLCGELLGGCAVSLSPNVTAFILLRCFTGLFGIAGCTVGYIYAVEIVDPRSRVLALCMSSFFCDIIKVILACLALLISNWRLLQLCGSLIDAVVLCLVLLVIPESPRWLVKKGDLQSAIKVLQSLSVTKAMALPDGLGDSLSKPTIRINAQDEKRGRVQDLFANKKLGVRSIEMMYSWFVIAMVFWAIYMNTGRYVAPAWQKQYVIILFAGGNILLADFIVFPIVNFCGRKFVHTISVIIIALALFTSPFVEGYGRTVNGWLGIISATYAFNLIYIRTGEIYPTTVRNVGFGLSSLFGRIGSVIFPFIDLSEESGMLWLPSIIYGLLNVVAAAAAWHLPETNMCKLPDNLEDDPALDVIQEDKQVLSPLQLGCIRCGESVVKRGSSEEMNSLSV